MEEFGVLSLGSRLKRLSDYLFQEVQAIYHDQHLPVSSTYFPILRSLQSSGAMSVMELAHSLQLSHPAISKQTSKMLKEGLLLKDMDKQDQRRFVLKLSPQAVQTMARLEPILQEMQWLLEQACQQQSEHFMQAIEHLERQVHRGSFATKVLERLEGYQLVPYDDTYQDAFYQLNMDWLQRYFSGQIEEADHRLLTRPEQVMSAGGEVWLAVSGRGNLLGSLVLEPPVNKMIKLSKLAVAAHYQQKGLGQALIDHSQQRANGLGIKKLCLETASCLQAARQLYEKNGFVLMPKNLPSEYRRADMYMEKQW